MKKKALSLLLIVLMIVSALIGLTACQIDTPEPDDDDDDEKSPEKLKAPVVTLEGNTASWEADVDADKFEISIDGALSYLENTVTSKTLTDGQTFKIRAVGDGDSFSTSPWSNSVTYTEDEPAPEPEKLATPAVSISDSGLATWQAVEGASGYVYKINGGKETATSATSVQLEDGDSITVRATGDGEEYIDGDFSDAVTYTASGTPTPPPPSPEKLATPAVSISDSGLASWQAVEGASGYVYKINGGKETATSATSVQLEDGDSITVRATGDGEEYIDGDFSDAVTYTASGTPTPLPPTPPSPTGAPSYLGIFASTTEPSQSAGLPEGLRSGATLVAHRMAASGMYRQFRYALDEYFANEENRFEGELPEESDYAAYARGGERVYVQIWLNNPSQYTILSLMLNGVKYQIGGGLYSFFIESGGQHYNCIYVAVDIEDGAHTEISYTVSNIEYIANTYINADGTDEFMNENDTVKIGLEYGASSPYVLDYNVSSLLVNGCTVSFNIEDAGGLTALSGGWLGVAVYDGYDIVATQRAAIGTNSFVSGGLIESTSYSVIVYLFADLHDGNGVCAHVLYEERIYTPSAISVEKIDSTFVYDSEKDGYYVAITVNTRLNSGTAEYIKLEICDDENVVYTDDLFSGVALVSEGILCDKNYRVRVYYKDSEYPEGRYVEEYAWTSYLGTPWYQEAGAYAFVSDAVYYFQLNNNDENYPAIDSFTLKLYNEESPRWVAEDVLYLLNNPTAIDDLNARIDTLRAEFDAAYGNFDLMNEIHAKISALEEELRPLEHAQWYIEYRAGGNTDKAYWEAEAANGKYFYELEYSGTDNDKIFKVGKYYYVILEGALDLGYGRLEARIEYTYDKLEGNGLTVDTLDEYIDIDNPFIYNGTELRDVQLSGETLTFSLVNVDDYMIPDGGESIYNKGYVYKVFLRSESWELQEIFAIDSIPTLSVDEDAWVAEYIRRIKMGESIDDLYEIYVPKYEGSYAIELDLSGAEAGRRNIVVWTRMMAEDYEENEYDRELSFEVGIYRQLPTPTIAFVDEWGNNIGVVAPDHINNWAGSYVFEAKDKNGNPVTITGEGSSYFNLPRAGTQIRVKLSEYEYWYESEWSEWYTFEGISLGAPSIGEYMTTTCTVRWSMENTENVAAYVYSINGGAGVTVALDAIPSVYLNNGDVLRVKCVPTEDAIECGYKDSKWAVFTCTDDRAPLDTPANLRIEGGALVWDAVSGASYYYIEITFDGDVTEQRFGNTSYPGLKDGATYRVRAVSKDTDAYRSSDYTESVSYNG